MQHQKCINVTIFGSSSTPFPPRINVGSCADGRIYASDSTLVFNIDSGGRGVVTNSSPSCEVKIRWCDHFSLRSSLWNGSQKFFNSWVIVVKIPRFGRVSLWALPNTRFSNKESKNIVTVEYQIPQNRQETLKEKLDFYAKLSGLPIFKLGNDPYVTA